MGARHLRYSFAEYVRFTRDALEKHDFVDGLILATPGMRLEDSGRSVAVTAALGERLRGRKYRVFEGSLRVRVGATGNAYFPDASVVHERAETDAEDEHSLSNPVVLVEVLSPSTAEYDRTDKLGDYQRIPSLRHIVHVFHDEQRIDVWTRGENDWTVTTHRAGDQAPLPAIGCTLDVSEIYRDPLAAPS